MKFEICVLVFEGKLITRARSAKPKSNGKTTIGSIESTQFTISTADVVDRIKAFLWLIANWSSHCAKFALGFDGIAWSLERWYDATHTIGELLWAH